MREELTVEQKRAAIAGLKLEDVMMVYSGRPGCMCGCLGTYKYASAHRAAGSKHRGYVVEPSEVNDHAVKLMFNRLKKADPETVDISLGCYFALGESTTRQNVLYVVPKK